MNLSPLEMKILRFLMTRSATNDSLITGVYYKNLRYIWLVKAVHSLCKLDLIEAHTSYLDKKETIFWTIKLPVEKLEKLLLL